MNSKSFLAHAARCLGYALIVIMAAQCSRQDTAGTPGSPAPSLAALAALPAANSSVGVTRFRYQPQAPYLEVCAAMEFIINHKPNLEKE